MDHPSLCVLSLLENFLEGCLEPGGEITGLERAESRVPTPSPHCAGSPATHSFWGPHRSVTPLDKLCPPRAETRTNARKGGFGPGPRAPAWAGLSPQTPQRPPCSGPGTSAANAGGGWGPAQPGADQGQGGAAGARAEGKKVPPGTPWTPGAWGMAEGTHSVLRLEAWGGWDDWPTSKEARTPALGHGTRRQAGTSLGRSCASPRAGRPPSGFQTPPHRLGMEVASWCDRSGIVHTGVAQRPRPKASPASAVASKAGPGGGWKPGIWSQTWPPSLEPVPALGLRSPLPHSQRARG